MRIISLLLFAVCATASTGQLCAQRNIKGYVNDYFVNVPRNYSPDDPWTMGRILRTEVGHGGFFYNCDSEECKRHSPYITWNRQSSECGQHQLIRGTVRQQLGEVAQRIGWGACCDCGNSSCDGQSCGCDQRGYASNAQNPGPNANATNGLSQASTDSLLSELRRRQGNINQPELNNPPIQRAARNAPQHDGTFRMIR